MEVLFFQMEILFFRRQYLEKGQQVSYIKSSHNYSESDIEEIKIIFEKLEKDNS